MGLTGRSLIITVLKCLVNQSAQLFLLRPSLFGQIFWQIPLYLRFQALGICFLHIFKKVFGDLLLPSEKAFVLPGALVQREKCLVSRACMVHPDPVVSITFPKAGTMPAHSWTNRTARPTCFTDTGPREERALQNLVEKCFLDP